MTWVSSCCDGLPANPDAPLSGNFCGKCHDHCEDWYDMDAIDPSRDVLPILTPEAWGRALSDFERDTIQRNREQNPFIGRALELDVLEANHADFLRQGRD